MDKHYSDEDLLSGLDGEVSKQKRKSINQHLEFCWSCRSRQAELERQIQAVSGCLNQLPVDPAWEDRARTNITLFQGQFEREFRRQPAVTFFRHRVWGLVAFAASLSVLVAFLLTHRPAPRPLTPKAVLNATEMAGLSVGREPVHQVFHVRELQLKPAGPTRQSRLEVWSDASSSRFASKWTTDEGRLTQAIWSTKEKSFVYAADKLQSIETSSASAPPDSVVNAEPDLRSIEVHFMNWLRERPWKPIFFLTDVSFWKADGATLRVDHLSSGQVRLTVKREKPDLRIELEAILNAETSLPVLQKLRITSGTRTVDFELSNERMDRRPVFAAAVFYPDRELAVASAGRTKLPERIPSSTKAAPAPTEPVDVEAEIGRLHANYILHLAGACRGVRVTITQESAGIHVMGSPESGDAGSYFTKDAGLGAVMNALAEIRDRRRNGTDTFPPGPAQEVVVDADAVELLAAEFSVQKMRAVPPEGLNLLRRMVEDHTATLRQTLMSLNGGSPSTHSLKTSTDAGRLHDWRETAAALASLAHSIDPTQGTSHTASEPNIIALARLANLLDRQVDEEVASDNRMASAGGENQSGRK